MYGFSLSQTLTITQRCFCVHSVIFLCHFPMWLFQVPHSSQTLYPISSPITLGNKSCQQILKKTEVRREFFFSIADSKFKTWSHPHPPLLFSPVPMEDVSLLQTCLLIRCSVSYPYALKDCFSDCVLSSVIFNLLHRFNIFNFLPFCQTVPHLASDTTTLNTLNLYMTYCNSYFPLIDFLICCHCTKKKSWGT